MQDKQYQALVKKKQPARPVWKNAVRAFFVGGTICAVGQAILNAFVRYGGMSVKAAAEPTAIVMVFLAAVLTAAGVYDRIAQVGGMGAALPITGFANAVVAPALEYRREGTVLGVGQRIFQVGGPVIMYGLVTAFTVGLIGYGLRLVKG